MEIVFVSSDNNQHEFDEYFAEMPWLALPYERRQDQHTLSTLFGVDGIPSFVVINTDGTLITVDGREEVERDSKCENFPHGWLPKPYHDLNDTAADLNLEKCVLALGTSQDLLAAVRQTAV